MTVKINGKEFMVAGEDFGKKTAQVVEEYAHFTAGFVIGLMDLLIRAGLVAWLAPYIIKFMIEVAKQVGGPLGGIIQ